MSKRAKQVGTEIPVELAPGDRLELERLEQMLIAEPTSERRKQELLAFKAAKGIKE